MIISPYFLIVNDKMPVRKHKLVVRETTSCRQCPDHEKTAGYDQPAVSGLIGNFYKFMSGNRESLVDFE